MQGRFALDTAACPCHAGRMAKLAENTRGALFMIGSMAGFTANDAFMKAAGASVPLSQALFLRGVLTVVLIYALARALGAGRLRFSKRDTWLIRLRNLAEVGTAYFFLTAIFNMPLANASAIMQALPLSVTLAGALFLGQAVGWRRLSAICVGLIGVLLIVRPGVADFNIYALYVVAAVLLVTARDILARKISAEVASIDIALQNAIAVTVVFGVAALFGDWVPVTGAAALQLLAAAVVITGAYTCAVGAMRAGDVAAIAPFRYTSLLWALLLGLVFFGEWPDPLTLLGAAIVVATGIYTFARERALAKARQAS